MNRRSFLKLVGATGLASIMPASLAFAGSGAGAVVHIGVITDLHHMIFKKDEVARLRAFIDAALAQQPDFIMQMGDFCYPINHEPLLAQWNRFTGDKYHVLGNHDMDYCAKPAIMKLWNMEKPYYSFDRGGFHFVVLDRNNIRNADGTIADYASGNWYKSKAADINFIDPKQLAWLRDDLAQAQHPTIIFMHQPLVATDSPDIGNGQELLDLFDDENYKARQKTGRPRVIAVIFGHDHSDQYAQRNDIHYLLINSASYAYHDGGPYYYQDPLFAFLTLDPAGIIKIKGRSTIYGPKAAPERISAQIPSKISDRILDVPTT